MDTRGRTTPSDGTLPVAAQRALDPDDDVVAETWSCTLAFESSLNLTTANHATMDRGGAGKLFKSLQCTCWIIHQLLEALRSPVTELIGRSGCVEHLNARQYFEESHSGKRLVSCLLCDPSEDSVHEFAVASQASLPLGFCRRPPRAIM